MSAEGVDTPQVRMEFQTGDDAEKGKTRKTPRRIIYFQDGDQLEEYSTEEEEEDGHDGVDVAVKRMTSMDWKSLPWSSYLFNLGVFGFLKAFKGLEYAGEVLSYKLGITAPKYQSEIEEAARMEAEEEAERERAVTEDASWHRTTANSSPKISADVPTSGMVINHNLMPSPIASSTPIH